MVNSTEFCSVYEKDVVPTLYGHGNDVYRYACLVLFIITFLYFSIGLVLFLRYKNTNVRLQSRSIFMTILLILSYIMMNLGVFMKEFVGRDVTQCAMYAWALYISFGVSGGAYIGNVARYMYKLRLQRDQGFQLIKQQRRHRHGDVENGAAPPLNVQNRASKRGLCYYYYDFLTMAKYSKNGRICIPGQEDVKDDHLSSNGSEGTGAYSLSLFLNDYENDDFTWTLWDKIKEEILMQLLIIYFFGSLTIILGFVRIYTEPAFYHLCKGCQLFPADYIIIAVNSGLSALYSVIMIHSVRNEPDPLGVISDGKIGLACFIFTIPVCILQIYDPNNYYRDYKFTWDIIFCLISCILFYPVIYGHLIKTNLERRRNKSRSKGLSVSTELSPRVATEITGNHMKYSSTNLPPASALDINLIIQEPKARNTLLEHMINELSSENLVFVFKVRAWKDIWSKDQKEKVNRIAVNLYNEYISRSGKAQINISNTVYSKIEKIMSSYLDSSNQKGGNVSPKDIDKIPITAFDGCEAECLKIIKTDTLPRFRQSALFKERIIDAGILDKVLNKSRIEDL